MLLAAQPLFLRTISPPLASDRRKLALIQFNANLEFAEGNNIGIRYALNGDIEYNLVLNNDTVGTPRIATQLVEAARKENAGIVGTRICYFDKPEPVWFWVRNSDGGTTTCGRKRLVM